MSETVVKVQGWREGFQKVRTSKHLREELGLNLAQAKNAVDRILMDEEVILVCSTQEQAASLRATLVELGANVSGL